MRNFLLVLATTALFCAPANAGNLNGRWHLTFELEGSSVFDTMVVETVVEFKGSKRVRGKSVSTAPSIHKEVFAAGGRTVPYVVIDVRDSRSGALKGKLRTVLGDAAIELSMTDQTLTGSFEGEISGKVSGALFEGALPLRDYDSVLQAMDSYTGAWIYDARLTRSDEWALFHDRLLRATAAAQDDFDMIAGFQGAWGDGLFSHYELLRPLKSMDNLIQQADERAMEKPIVHTEFTEDNIAIIVIDSFFGAKIEQQIDSAFWQVAQRNPRALIIDVRENGGGTLAAWPVGARIVREEAVGGYFISNRWWSEHSELPDDDFLTATASPPAVTPQAFQQDLFSDGVLVMRIASSDKTFDGPVYALTSVRSRSATEAVIGVLQYLDRIEVIGETSGGYMLNSRIFEVEGGFSLRIPIADFFLPNHKSIEGVGIVPDIAVAAEDALATALERIRHSDAP